MATKKLIESAVVPEIICPVSKTVIRKSVSSEYGDESRFLTEFEEICLLGEGGYGVVVKCKNYLDEKIYAVKKILLNQKEMPFHKAKREVLAISSMNHPHIVRYFHAWVERHAAGICSSSSGEEETPNDENEVSDPPCLYIQMEYCPGSLKDLLLDLGKSLEKEKGSIIVRQIVLALDHIHDKGYIHGDISRNNILFDEEGEVKVGDFGLAKLLDSVGVTSGSSPKGTYFYVAPEGKTGFKSDIYGLGILMGEILNPYTTESERVLELEKFKTNRDELPTSWINNREAIKLLLNENPTNRPSIAEVSKNVVFWFK